MRRRPPAAAIDVVAAIDRQLRAPIRGVKSLPIASLRRRILYGEEVQPDSRPRRRSADLSRWPNALWRELCWRRRANRPRGEERGHRAFAERSLLHSSTRDSRHTHGGLLTYQTRLISSGAMGVPVLQTNALRKPSRFASTPLTRYLPGACGLVLASSLADSSVWFSHQPWA